MGVFNRKKAKSKEEMEIDAKPISCSNCGSEDVEELRWIKVNEDTIGDKQSQEVSDQWCNNCEEHVEFNTS